MYWELPNTSSIGKIWKRAHDTILFYTKSDDYIFNFQRKPLSEGSLKIYSLEDERGRHRLVPLLVSGIRNGVTGQPWRGIDPNKRGKNGMHWVTTHEKLEAYDDAGLIVWPEKKDGAPNLKYYLDANPGVVVSDLWDDILSVGAVRTQSLNYPTQKPEVLLERIVKTSSNEGAIVADFFCGSGTTAAVAEKLGRRWITSDLSKTSIQVARSRLVNQDAAPFLVQNLGNYQRQLIYLKDVKLKEMYNIVLKLYGAVPRNDWQGFGTKKDEKDTLVYVSEPDRPVTGKKAIDLAKITSNADGKGYKRLVILAWDYEYNFEEDFARLKKNTKTRKMPVVEFKIIPSDVYRYLRSTNVGDVSIADKITFYQKPYLRLT
ncbi:MAG: site-specific DNA-methyltransferase [Euryarchaeota archaeon]|nr:site-specific DNA-methyltransferase [Euryarchaeota archaeon]